MPVLYFFLTESGPYISQIYVMKNKAILAFLEKQTNKKTHIQNQYYGTKRKKEVKQASQFKLFLIYTELFNQ